MKSNSAAEVVQEERREGAWKQAEVVFSPKNFPDLVQSASALTVGTERANQRAAKCLQLSPHRRAERFWYSGDLVAVQTGFIDSLYSLDSLDSLVIEYLFGLEDIIGA